MKLIHVASALVLTVGLSGVACAPAEDTGSGSGGKAASGGSTGSGGSNGTGGSSSGGTTGSGGSNGSGGATGSGGSSSSGGSGSGGKAALDYGCLVKAATSGGLFRLL